MFCKLESAVFVLSLLAALQCSAGIKANRLRDEKGGLQSQRNSTSESTSPLKGHNVHTSRLVKGKNHDTTNDISLEAVPVTSNGRTISRDTTAKLGGLHAKPTGEKNFDTSKRQDIPLGGDPADYGLQSYQFATSNQGDPSELPLEGENALVHEMTGDPQEMSRLPQPYPFADSSPTWDESDPIADPSADEPIGKRNYFAPRPGEDYKVTHVHVFHPRELVFNWHIWRHFRWSAKTRIWRHFHWSAKATMWLFHVYASVYSSNDFSVRFQQTPASLVASLWRVPMDTTACARGVSTGGSVMVSAMLHEDFWRVPAAAFHSVSLSLQKLKSVGALEFTVGFWTWTSILMDFVAAHISLIDSFIARSIGRLVSCLIGLLVGCVNGWLIRIDWMNVWLIDWLIDWMVGWVLLSWYTDQSL